MNLSFVTEVLHGDVPAPNELGWQVGDAWLAGGTWLFSEPQDDLRRLIDLHAYGWPSLEEEEDDAGPSIGATCTIAELDTYAAQQRASGWGLVREVACPLRPRRSRSGMRRPSAATSACHCPPVR